MPVFFKPWFIFANKTMNMFNLRLPETKPSPREARGDAIQNPSQRPAAARHNEAHANLVAYPQRFVSFIKNQFVPSSEYYPRKIKINQNTKFLKKLPNIKYIYYRSILKPFYI